MLSLPGPRIVVFSLELLDILGQLLDLAKLILEHIDEHLERGFREFVVTASRGIALPHQYTAHRMDSQRQRRATMGIHIDEGESEDGDDRSAVHSTRRPMPSARSAAGRHQSVSFECDTLIKRDNSTCAQGRLVVAQQPRVGATPTRRVSSCRPGKT